MKRVLKYEEIKAGEHDLYSECYEVKFWKKIGEFWKQLIEYYYTDFKGDGDKVYKHWKSEHAKENVTFISITYQ